VRGFAANIATASTGLVGAAVLSLLVSIVTARMLGVEEFGLYGFAFAYVALWAVLMDGGASALAPREVARGHGPRALAVMFGLKPLLVATALVLALGVGALAGFSAIVLWLVAVLAVGSAIDTCFGLGLAAFRGREQFGVDAAHQLGQRALFGLLAVLALLAGAGALGVAAARAVSLAVAAGSVLWLLHRRGAIGPLPGLAGLRAAVPELAPAAAPLLVADLMTQVHTRASPLVLQFTRGLSDVGLFVAPYRLIEGLFLFPTAFGLVLLPRLVAAHRRDRQAVATEMDVGLRFVAAAGAAVLVGGAVWADEIVLLLFGREYAASAAPLRVLLGMQAVMMVNAVLRTGLIAAGAERSWAAMLTVAAGVNVIGAALLTPSLGPGGAAWSALGGELLLCLGCLLSLVRRTPGFLPVRSWAIIAATATCAFLALAAIKSVSPPASAALTVVAVVGGFELLSPVGLRDILKREPSVDGSTRA
jgi:O-antigen/teichoic acid export membrane protein